jgi:hypothetical protein
MIHIKYRTHNQDADFAGRTVGEVRTAYENNFGIPADATPFVNGQQVGEDHQIDDTAKVEFVHSSTKGGPNN